MSRFKGSERILAAAEHWKRRCLLEERSVFSDRALWTRGNFDELQRLFVENPDDTKDHFLVKLQRQLEPGSPDAKCLWAEMSWVYRLIEVRGSMTAATKRGQIGRVWGWSGRDFPEEHELLHDDVLGAGVVNPGPAYNTLSWREYQFFIDGIRVWFDKDRDSREALAADPWRFAAWLDGTEYAANRAFRHAMLFLLFPDDFEPIVSSQNKVTIVETLHEGDLPDVSSALALDRALGAIRQRLEEQHPGFHFYLSPVRELWQPPENPDYGEKGEATASVASRRGHGSLNTILYGPPGTGKTYRTASRCVEICDGVVLEGDELRRRYEALVDEGRVKFVTFHQSYGYEEFVEGIRPMEQDGEVVYRVEPGILKSLADAARDEAGEGLAAADEARTLEGREVSDAGEPSFETLWAALRDRARDRPMVRTWGSARQYALVLREDRVELQPVGGGTPRRFTREAVRKLWESGDRRDPERTSVGEIEKAYGTGRHGSYLWIIYNELWNLAREARSVLIEIPDESTADLHAGGSGSASGPPSQRRDVAGRPNFVLVVDEINRANISKVMGELITLLEEDKREGGANVVTVTLPYSQEAFTLPANLHILGTMNTADRSIALLDTALRRRFDFEEVAPAPELLDKAAERTGVDLPGVLTTINERLEYLVDRDHLIGHAWLMRAESREGLDQIMRRKVIPLIAEYFYDDWNKVRAVLGGTDAFVERNPLRSPPGIEREVSERYRWTVRQDFPGGAYEDLLSDAGEASPSGD